MNHFKQFNQGSPYPTAFQWHHNFNFFNRILYGCLPGHPTMCVKRSRVYSIGNKGKKVSKSYINLLLNVRWWSDYVLKLDTVPRCTTLWQWQYDDCPNFPLVTCHLSVLSLALVPTFSFNTILSFFRYGTENTQGSKNNYIFENIKIQKLSWSRQHGSIGGKFETGWHRRPHLDQEVKNLGCIPHRNRVIANMAIRRPQHVFLLNRYIPW